MTKNNKTKPLSDEDWQYIPLEEQIFTTYDLGVSTALLCSGFHLLSIERDNPKKALFIFQKEEGIEDIANRYFSDRLEVKARSYFDHLKALKNQLYSE